jgi:hypothetical protein
LSYIAKKLLIGLIFAHFFGDFLLQGNAEISRKHNITDLIKHSAILGILSYIFCGLWMKWEIPLAIFVTHFIIDLIIEKFSEKDLKAFTIEQFAHLIVITGISLILPVMLHQSLSPFWERLLGIMYYKSIILLSGAIVTINVGSHFIGLAVRPFLDQLEEVKKTVSSTAVESIELMSRGFESGGRIIGQLERAMIFLFVLVDLPSAIGFLITAKSILRFGEIKDRENRMEAEYIIIGTLMSFLFAIFFAYITKYLFNVI